VPLNISVHRKLLFRVFHLSTTICTHVHLTSPYHDKDVLPTLQLLANLSKYPHVLHALYKRCNGFHLANALAVAAAKAAAAEMPEQPLPKVPEIVRENKALQSQIGLRGRPRRHCRPHPKPRFHPPAGASPHVIGVRLPHIMEVWNRVIN
jgi:hypothetical protein